ASFTPLKPPAMRAAVASAASMSSPSAGLIWMVASRAIWLSQTAAELLTSETAPKVRQDRNVMIAMTEISERPATFCSGTIVAILRCRRGTTVGASAGGAGSLAACCLASVMDLQPSGVEHHPARLDLVHESQVVSGDQHGGAQPVELDEQPE